MKFQPFDLFRSDYDQAFYKTHLLRKDLNKTKLVAGTFDAKVKARPDQRLGREKMAEESKVAIYEHVVAVIATRRPAEILRAARNVARFNAVHSYQAPLVHPAVMPPNPSVGVVTQLRFELHALETARQHKQERHEEDVQYWKPITGATGPVAAYEKRITSVLGEEAQRLTRKYDHVGLVAQAALLASQQAHNVVVHYPASSEGLFSPANPTFAPEERDALRALFQQVKRSLSVAKSDLAFIHGLYDKAQSSMLQFAKLRPELAEQAPGVLPMRVPNLLGPGEVMATSTNTAKSLKALSQKFIETLQGLETPGIRHRISELSAAQTALGRALRNNTAPIFLGDRLDA